MGRNRVPDEVKRLRGTLQPCRELKNVPAVQGSFRLKPPSWLSPEEKKAFKAAAAILSDWGILSPADEGLIAMYVNALAKWKDAERHLREDGAVVLVKDEDDNLLSQQLNLYYQVSKDAVKQAAALQQQLGFGPVARAKILSMIGKGEEDKDDFSEFDQ